MQFYLPTHRFIHIWNKLSGLYSPAAEHHCTLARCECWAVSKWVSVLRKEVSDKFMKRRNKNKPSPFPGRMS